MSEKIHQSTPEEIEAARERVKAAECKGDGVHSTDMRFWHDWRLWKRVPLYQYGEYDGEVPQSLLGLLTGFQEQWYCTRCRKIEERTVTLDGSEPAA